MAHKKTSRIKTVLADALKAYNQPLPKQSKLKSWQKEREAEQSKLISKIQNKIK